MNYTLLHRRRQFCYLVQENNYISSYCLEMTDNDSFQKKGSKKKSVFSFLLVIIILVILLPATVFAVKYVVELRAEAGPTEKPKRIEVTNIMDTTATVSWVTPNLKTTGYIKYGTTSDVSNVAFDDRDGDKPYGSYSCHFVNLSGLSPNKTYYYTIVVGGKEYDQGGKKYELKTGPVLESIATPRPIKGTVSDPSGGQEELIVYLYAQKGSEVSEKISTLTTNGRYALDLANLRKANLSAYFQNLIGATLYVYADGAERGEGSVTTQIIELTE